MLLLASHELLELLLPHLAARPAESGSWRGAATLSQLSRAWHELVALHRLTLTELTIVSPQGYDPMPLDALKLLIPQCTSLQKLELIGHCWDTWKDEKAPMPIDPTPCLAFHCRQLHTLLIAPAELVDDSAMYALAGMCRLLEDVALVNGGSFSNGALRALGTCPLKRFFLNKCDVESNGLSALVLQASGTLQSIAALEATGPTWDAASGTLQVGRCIAGDEWAYHAAASCPVLEELMWHCSTSEGIRAVAGTRPMQLTTVRLGPLATDGWIRTLVEACPSLTDLFLSADALTDDALRSVATLGRLRHFSLADKARKEGAKFTDAGLAMLSECTRLCSLTLGRFISNDAVTDASLVAIGRGCPRLTSLQLVFCRFSGRALALLAHHCRSLRYVALDWSSTTPGAVRALHQHCTEIRSLHLPPNHCVDGFQVAEKLFGPDVATRSYLMTSGVLDEGCLGQPSRRLKDRMRDERRSETPDDRRTASPPPEDPQPSGRSAWSWMFIDSK